MKVFALVLCLAAAASARMAYRFSDGYLDILGAEPLQNFDCTGRAYGYYADTDANCQVFHVCLPITDEAGEVAETAHYSFMCNNETIFDQESLTCNWKDNAFPCSEAQTLYDLSNAEFGRIPEGGFDVVLEGSSNVPVGAPAPAPAPVRARSQITPTAAAEIESEAEAEAVELKSETEAEIEPETEAEAETEDEVEADAVELKSEAEANAVEVEADVENTPEVAAPAASVAIPASVPVLAAAAAAAAAEAEVITELAHEPEGEA